MVYVPRPLMEVFTIKQRDSLTNPSSTVDRSPPSTIQVPNNGASTSERWRRFLKSDGGSQFQTRDPKVMTSLCMCVYIYICYIYIYLLYIYNIHMHIQSYSEYASIKSVILDPKNLDLIGAPIS